MIGSLDNPPIIIRQRRGKILLAVPLFFFGIFFFHGVASGLDGGVAVAFTAMAYLSAIFVLGGLVALVWPTTMIIAPDGLTLRTFRPIKFSWSDFHTFHVVGVPLMARFVAYTTPAHPRRKLIFGGEFAVKPKELVCLLTQAKRRWGPPD